MSVIVFCPHCSQELKSPDKLVGKLVACPNCKKQFAISAQANGNKESVSSSMEVTERPRDQYYPPGFNKPTPPAQHPTPPTPHPAPQSASPASNAEPQSPPVQPGPTDNLKYRVLGVGGKSEGKTARFKSPPPANPAAGNAPATQPAATRPPPAQAAAQDDETTASLKSPGQRTAKSARFVAAGAVKSRINLGEDGQLPELVVKEGKETTKELTEKSQTSNPLLIVAVLCVSVFLSLIVLVFPSGANKEAAPDKQTARAKIQQYYIGKQEPFEPYQKKLRAALMARDEAEARKLYLDVLKMLREESSTGMTSIVQGKAPPNDKDLEEQILILLRED